MSMPRRARRLVSKAKKSATILGWKYLFIEQAHAEIVRQSLDWHRRHGRWSLFVLVIMPNHTHFIIRPLGEQTISTVLQSLGSYTAHAILDQLRQDGRTGLLVFFAQRQDHDTSKKRQIWLPIEAKNIHSAASGERGTTLAPRY
jgi:REP element-mobilizing transposase RayT